MSLVIKDFVQKTLNPIWWKPENDVGTKRNVWSLNVRKTNIFKLAATVGRTTVINNRN